MGTSLPFSSVSVSYTGIFLPRASRLNMSARKRMDPLTICPLGACTRRISESEVTDLPQPLSPTTPTVEPAGTENVTPFTALTVPASEKKYVWRSSNSTILLGSFISVIYSSGRTLRFLAFSKVRMALEFSLAICRDSLCDI